MQMGTREAKRRMRRLNRRYRDELHLRRWLRYRDWRWWDVWRVIGWGIAIGTILATLGEYYAYR